MYAIMQIKDKVTSLEKKTDDLMASNKELRDKVKDLAYQIKLLREMLKRRSK